MSYALGVRGSVHPHACGEHRRRRFLLAKEFGSSPRLWGTLRGLSK
ncbi:hypothetical protein D1AOALGA4SA_11476 [Olavius algarvensis Delta 1 endosymbiont]|nr:hypothetical protein D1AOALGA4SA_11476 [Olavius algarvensis Delta 1 endosymbiont]